jgi:hypothetical protein
MIGYYILSAKPVVAFGTRNVFNRPEFEQRTSGCQRRSKITLRKTVENLEEFLALLFLHLGKKSFNEEVHSR